MTRKASRVKEQVASWSQVRQLLRSGDPEDRGQDQGRQDPADLQQDVHLVLQHEVEVPGEVVDAVDPHDDGRLEDGHPEYAEAAAVGVH